MVRIKRNGTKVPKDIDGCTLVPLSKAEDDWPKVQDGILPNTFYRVQNDTGELKCMVTVMPDGLRVAWGSCGKCHDHITLCRCRSGVYHCSSIGFIRATYDVDYPTERVTDYRQYFDPFQRAAGKPYDRLEVRAFARPLDAPPKPSTPRVEARKAKQKAARDMRDQVAPVDGGLTAADIAKIDMSAVAKEAAKQAEVQTKQVRKFIRRRKAAK